MSPEPITNKRIHELLMEAGHAPRPKIGWEELHSIVARMDVAERGATELAKAGSAVIDALQRSATIITDQDVHSALNALASVLDRIRGDAP